MALSTEPDLLLLDEPAAASVLRKATGLLVTYGSLGDYGLSVIGG